MFTHRCTECERTQLIFPSQSTGVATVEGREAVAFTCWCGAAQTHVMGAARAEQPELVTA